MPADMRTRDFGFQNDWRKYDAQARNPENDPRRTMVEDREGRRVGELLQLVAQQPTPFRFVFLRRF